jgi:nucleoside-diphosphate-sugar epimerase
MGQASTMAKVLIAGCGYVGGTLGQLLVADGHEVYGLKRNPDNLAQGIKPIRADLSLPVTLGGLPASIDYIFYTAGATAGATTGASTGRGDEENYRKSYLDGVGRLLSSLAELGEKPKRIFFTSSTSV